MELGVTLSRGFYSRKLGLSFVDHRTYLKVTGTELSGQMRLTPALRYFNYIYLINFTISSIVQMWLAIPAAIAEVSLIDYQVTHSPTSFP